MVDSVVIGIGVFSLELDHCCFQSAVDFSELEGSEKRNLVTLSNPISRDTFTYSASFFWKDRKNTLHAVDTKLLIHFPVRQIKIER